MRSVLALVVLLVGQVASVRVQEPLERFEVVSVKRNAGDGAVMTERPPDGLVLLNYSAADLVTYAFDVQMVRVRELPSWTLEERFDVRARAARGTLTDDDRRMMLRALLADRFGAKTHVESREQTVLVLTMARADRRLGSGLTPRTHCESTPCVPGGMGFPDRINAQALPMPRLVRLLSAMRREVVHDETGLTGIYDVSMSFRPEQAVLDPNEARPSFFSAIEEQLGLKLTPQRRPVDVIVVDTIARPTPD